MSKWVHACANSYRQLINAMSYPGEIFTLEMENVVNDFSEYMDKSVLLMAKMLLDSEVTFSVLSSNAEAIMSCIKMMTSAQSEELCKADYIFLVEDFSADTEFEEKVKQVIERIKQGDLLNPHCSGTLIIFRKKVQKNKCYKFKGPGILASKLVDMYDMGEIISLRNKNMKEFPMGFDVVVINNHQGVLGFPRTTIIEEVV